MIFFFFKRNMMAAHIHYQSSNHSYQSTIIVKAHHGKYQKERKKDKREKIIKTPISVKTFTSRCFIHTLIRNDFNNIKGEQL